VPPSSTAPRLKSEGRWLYAVGLQLLSPNSVAVAGHPPCPDLLPGSGTGLSCLLSILDLRRSLLFSAVTLSLRLQTCVLVFCAFYTSTRSYKSRAQPVVSHPYGTSFRVRLCRLRDIKSSRSALHNKPPCVTSTALIKRLVCETKFVRNKLRRHFTAQKLVCTRCGCSSSELVFTRSVNLCR